VLEAVRRLPCLAIGRRWRRFAAAWRITRHAGAVTIARLAGAALFTTRPRLLACPRRRKELRGARLVASFCSNNAAAVAVLAYTERLGLSGGLAVAAWDALGAVGLGASFLSCALNPIPQPETTNRTSKTHNHNTP